MFTIQIQVVGDEAVELTGLEALDFARRHGLPDTSRLVVTDENVRSAVTAEVTEGFARAWFRPHAVLVVRTIRPEQLAKGDLVTGNYPGQCGFAELSVERVKELWLAGEKL